jgi:transcriptional regulator GlxA family with amidase domain
MLRKRTGIVLFDEVEVLDFCGPLEVFSAVRLCEQSRRQDKSPFEVVLIAQHGQTVTTTGGMKLIPNYSFRDSPELDIMVVPGGWGTRKEISNEILLAWLAKQATQVELVVSVCTGSLLLGFAGLLTGCRATTHWRTLEWMRTALPNVIVDDTKHFILEGKVWTSAGISAGIDMALKVVEHYYGEEIARATARHMEYPYPETDERRIDVRS